MSQTAARVENEDEGSKFTPPSNGEVSEEGYDLSRFAKLKKMGVNGLISEGARLCELYNRATPYLKALAEVVTALKAKYKAPVGEGRGYVKPAQKNKVPDWGGQSEGYQAAVEKIYDQAGLGTGEARRAVKNALAYHAQNMVKEVAKEEDLVTLGIKAEKRGAGGTAGGKTTGSGTQKTTTTAAGSTTTTPASKTATTRPKAADIAEFMGNAVEMSAEVLKTLSYCKEAAKKGIPDDEKRIAFIHTLDMVKKNSNACVELAEELLGRHQGRSVPKVQPKTQPKAEPKAEPEPEAAKAS